MKRYEEFIGGLQQDIEVPDDVWRQYVHTLEQIGQCAGQKEEGTMIKQGGRKAGWKAEKSRVLEQEMNLERNQVLEQERNLERIKTSRSRARRRTWVKAAAAAGVVATGIVALSYTNPVAASKLPLIGRIFEQVAQDATYAGNYDKKVVLEEEKAGRETGAEETGNAAAGTKAVDENAGVYTSSDQGVAITASEVYCDGYSIYLTAQVTSEEGGFTNIPSHYTRRFENKTSQSIHATGVCETTADGQKMDMFGLEFEGKAVDDHTFVGMIKVDMDSYSATDDIARFKLTEIAYSDQTLESEDDIEWEHRIQGSWELEVPFSVDTTQCREIPINRHDKAGYTLRKVFVSPYQVIVFSDTPYTTLSPEEYTKEDFKRQWGQKNEEIAAYGGEEVTYDQMLARKYYEYYELAVYNQDGESLEMQYGDEKKTVFAVQGHTLSKLHIYAGDKSHEMELIKAKDEQEAKEKSVLDAEVDLRKDGIN